MIIKIFIGEFFAQNIPLYRCVVYSFILFCLPLPLSIIENVKTSLHFGAVGFSRVSKEIPLHNNLLRLGGVQRFSAGIV